MSQMLIFYPAGA